MACLMAAALSLNTALDSELVLIIHFDTKTRDNKVQIEKVYFLKSRDYQEKADVTLWYC